MVERTKYSLTAATPLPLFLAFVAACGSTAPSILPVADGAPGIGPADAPVVIVEFGDYQCGPCSRMGRSLHALQAERPGELRFVYRHCPARLHPVGRMAAIAAAATPTPAAFWQLHWRFVLDGPVTTEEQLWELVSQAGLDEGSLRRAIATGAPEATVVSDLALADRLAVRGMPTTFINGRRIQGAQSLDRLRRELSRAAGPAALLAPAPAVPARAGLTPHWSRPHTGPPSRRR